MKLTARDAAGFLSRPDPAVPGLLIFGADPMRVAEKRQRVIAALIGPEGDGEMRLTRISGADLRRDPAQAIDAMTARGFFDGPRAVLIDEATDGLTDVLAHALKEHRDGDAMLVVTAGELKSASRLRKLFEGDRRARALAVYDDPMSRADIEQALTAEGLRGLPDDTMAALIALAADLEPGDFRQTLTRIALFKLDDPAPLTPQQVADLAPLSAEAALDDLLDAVADGRAADLPGLMARLFAQGVAPVTLCIGLVRHFRLLHSLASHPDGPAQAVAGMRPPIFGARRDRLLRQGRRWPLARIEGALGVLIDTDMVLRSASPAPGRALLERALLGLVLRGEAGR